MHLSMLLPRSLQIVALNSLATYGEVQKLSTGTRSGRFACGALAAFTSFHQHFHTLSHQVKVSIPTVSRRGLWGRVPLQVWCGLVCLALARPSPCFFCLLHSVGALTRMVVVVVGGGDRRGASS